MEEKLISELKSLGCKTNKEAAVTVQVYLELCERKKYFDVQYFYDDLSESVYLTAKTTKSSKANVFIPIHSSQDLSINILRKYLHLLGKHGPVVTLVFVESSSTSVFYQIADGLTDVKEASPKGRNESKREQRNSEIKKLRPLIEQSALCGLSLSTFSNTSENT